MADLSLNFSNSSQKSYLSKFRFFSWLATLSVFIFGCVILTGWLLDISNLKGSWAQGINVKANTGICFILTSFSLLLYKSSSQRLSKAIGQVLGTFAFLVGFLTILEHLTGHNFGIDELFFREDVGGIATASPNRMGPPASICFMLLGSTLTLLHFETKRFENYASNIAIVTCSIALLPILGYTFGARELYGVAQYTGISLPSAIAFLILSTGLLFSCNQSRILTIMCSEHAGGVLLRRLLLPALLLPPLLGYLRAQGEELGLFHESFGRALLIVAILLVFTRLVWASAKVLEVIDRQRVDLIESERAARNTAERANRFKDEFLATLSHELRTPLNAILGWSQLLKRKAPESSETALGLDTIERNARLQAQLISDLLDMSRIISGKFRLNFNECDLQSVLTLALRSIQLEAKEKNISIHKEFSSNPILLRGDQERLQQIFWNLLSNAVKFTQAGGSITVTMEQIDSSVSISIRDTGQGIAPEFLARIFHRFTQADSSSTRRHGGLGIGLSIVHELVSLHQGTVTATSDGLGKGARFTVTLPISPIMVSGRPSDDKTSLPKPKSAISLEGIKILVVEDDKDARELTGRILTEREAEVLLCGSVAEALLQFAEFKPDILISDIGMPNEDGYQLIKELRNRPAPLGGELPAIALTAFVRDIDKFKILNSGYSAHVAKPIDASELLDTIARLAAAKGNVPQRRAVNR